MSKGTPIKGQFYVTRDYSDGRFVVEIYDQNGKDDVLVAQGISYKSIEIAAGKAFIAWFDLLFRMGRPEKKNA